MSAKNRDNKIVGETSQWGFEYRLKKTNSLTEL